VQKKERKKRGASKRKKKREDIAKKVSRMGLLKELKK